MKNTILITLNRELFNEYRKVYFKANPRAKKFPFDTKGKIKKARYSVLSLNDMLPISSMMYSSMKSKWGDFGKWVAQKYGVDNMQINNAILEIRVYSETRAKKDNDNVAGGYKIFGDGFAVQSNMFIDDNYNHINPLIISSHYDKENPRMEIRISVFDSDIKDVYVKLKKHIEYWE